VTNENRHVSESRIQVGEQKFGRIALRLHAVACANPKCRDVTLAVTFISGTEGPMHSLTNVDVIEHMTLRPLGTTKPQPDYIPPALREDYYEACRIRDLSPKSAATLARRCLQGMVRDFCSIAKGRLIDELKELRIRVDGGSAPAGVTAETVEAIDHVRSIGAIGAHMEKDINLIIDVEPGEAQALIELVEMLFDEWYVARKARQDRLAAVKQIREEKAAAQQDGRASLSGKAMKVASGLREKH
jgi:hypothetical protein